MADIKDLDCLTNGWMDGWIDRNINSYLDFRDRSLFAESVEIDQPAHTCSQILLYTFRYYVINLSIEMEFRYT